MSLKELGDELAERTGLTRPKSRELLREVFDIMRGRLLEGNEVRMTTLGKLVIEKRAGRPNMLGLRGERFDMPAMNVIRFRPSREVKARAQKLDVS